MKNYFSNYSKLVIFLIFIIGIMTASLVYALTCTWTETKITPAKTIYHPAEEHCESVTVPGSCYSICGQGEYCEPDTTQQECYTLPAWEEEIPQKTEQIEKKEECPQTSFQCSSIYPCQSLKTEYICGFEGCELQTSYIIDDSCTDLCSPGEICSEGKCVKTCDTACISQGYAGGCCGSQGNCSEMCLAGGYSKEVINIGSQGDCKESWFPTTKSCYCCQPMIETKIDCAFSNCIFDATSIKYGEKVAVGGYLRTSDGKPISGRNLSLWYWSEESKEYKKVMDLGKTNSNGYVGKYWSPEDIYGWPETKDSYMGSHRYVLFFEGDDLYKKSQTSDYALNVEFTPICQSKGAVGGEVVPFHCTGYNDTCGWFTWRAFEIPMGASTVCTIGNDCSFALSNTLIKYRGDSCIGSETICQTGGCPNYSGKNGENCTVRKSDCSTIFLGSYGVMNSGYWDASEKKCVQCTTDGKEKAVCGDTNSIYLKCDYWNKDNAACQGQTNGQCELACNSKIDPICDDRVPGKPFWYNGIQYTCDDKCQIGDKLPPKITIKVLDENNEEKDPNDPTIFLKAGTYTLEITIDDQGKFPSGLDRYYGWVGRDTDKDDSFSLRYLNKEFSKNYSKLEYKKIDFFKKHFTVGKDKDCSTEGRRKCQARIKVWDRFGNLASTTISFNIDITPPQTEIK